MLGGDIQGIGPQFVPAVGYQRVVIGESPDSAEASGILEYQTVVGVLVGGFEVPEYVYVFLPGEVDVFLYEA